MIPMNRLVESLLPHGDRQRTALPLEPIVQAFCSSLEAPSQSRQPSQTPPPLPSPKVMRSLLDGLSAVLYPHGFGSLPLRSQLVSLDEFSTDFFVGQTLAVTLMELQQQIGFELALSRPPELALVPRFDRDDQAARMIKAFAERLPILRARLDLDLAAAVHGDSATASPEEMLMCDSRLRAVMVQRFAHELHRLGAPGLAGILAEIVQSETGVDIHPGAVIEDQF